MPADAAPPTEDRPRSTEPGPPAERRPRSTEGRPRSAEGGPSTPPTGGRPRSTEPGPPAERRPRSAEGPPTGGRPRSAEGRPRTPPTERRPRSAAGRARRAHERLAREYPGDAVALCALRHRNPYELLAATILSAQTTDERVNMVTPALFERYPAAEELAQADPDELEDLIRSTGFYRSKARSLIGMATGVVERFGGEVPMKMSDLVTLPGVGRKTANVVRSVVMGEPGLPVDTHVGRLARRLGLTTETDPVTVELELNPMVPAKERGLFSLRLILHGRAICAARKPRCGDCVLNDFCPSAFRV